MSTKRSHEGYLLIDHRETPGVTEEFVQQTGQVDAVPVGKNSLFESATITCSHCQRVVVLNPDRSRSRGYCRKCDHYICDACTTVMAQTLECVPFRKILDDAQESAERGVSPSIILGV
jgi:hypothetical protein